MNFCRRYLTTLVCCVLYHALSAQSLQESNSHIPNDYLYQIRMDTLEEELNSLSSSNVDRFKKITLLQSEFIFNEWVTDGKILIADSLSSYLGDIKGILLNKRPWLNEQISIYAIRRSKPEAFITVNGRLFVSTGLISKVSNEAQLAMILAHEIGHYSANDIYERIERIHRSLDGTSNSEENQTQKILERIHDFDDEAELAADKFALNLLYESNEYSVPNPKEILELIYYPDIPLGEVQLNLDALLPADIVVNPRLVMKGDISGEIVSRIEPNILSKIEKRNLALTDEIKKKLIDTESGNRLCPLGEERFWRIQKEARYITLRTQLSNRMYSRVIFDANHLLGIYPELRPDLVLLIGHSIHAIATYKTYVMYETIRPNSDSSIGEITKLHWFFDNIAKDDATALALSYNFALYQEYPTNKCLERIVDASVRDLVRVHDKSLSYYSQDIVSLKIDTLTQTELEQLSKLDKIRYQRRLAGNDNNWASALLNRYGENEQLKNIFSREKASFQEFDQHRVVESEVFNVRTDYEQNWIEYGKKQTSLGLDRITWFEPWVYINKHYTLGGHLEVIESLKMRKTMATRSILAIDVLGIDYEYLSSEDESLDLEVISDYFAVANFVLEERMHGFVPVVNSSYSEIRAISNKLNTNYIVIPNLHVEKAPWSINSLIIHNKNELILQVIDTDEGTIKWNLYRVYKGNLTDALLAQMIYEGASQLN